LCHYLKYAVHRTLRRKEDTFLSEVLTV
jgi:hypothetical protein